MLNNKVIFLTGGSTGIGLECARKYREAGASVAIFANDPGSVATASAALDVLGIVGDVACAGDVSGAIQRTLDRYGRIDAIHNNAGVAQPAKPLHETSSPEWDLLFDVNVKGVLHTTQFGLAALRESRGCILQTSSLVGQIGQENHAAYAATKGALDALTKSMAIDYARYGIRVNAVAPAGVWTPMLREWGAAQPDPQGISDYLDAIHLLGYCPEGDVVADACVFLVSEQARFITGCVMPVSGGAELGYRR
ncbi:SDR family NAD(P)-dependent oxidoreductase [Dinghuibacter silviterrae]|uniref:NAD(P)-dependent dehydrogenase (Short-subunit alcohol dehydrogenase family) n=1 Tax=Dinghuibacter silviterrae TaxID=1539049 RepID=A0A4V3GKT6_9BACT|nr:SDR family oxidoreductase [Dinghuibacter silviterrae]TDW96882.1 NAD(P)-dependent dehydrogenase (short-subunit alcohol dehydrogenase family) [Dinghuibacter silviterrae]